MDDVAEYVGLWRELDALPESDFEGAVGDALRDRMDGPWRKLCAAGLRPVLAEKRREIAGATGDVK